MKNMEGKIVVITGASRRLGEATARMLSAEGAAAELGARRAERIQALAMFWVEQHASPKYYGYCSQRSRG